MSVSGRRLVAALVAVGVGFGGAAVADEPVVATTGTRVRVTAPSIARGRLVGNLIRLDDSVLALRSDDGKSTKEVPRAAITRVEVSRHRSQKGKGALIGMMVGAGAALALGIGTGRDCSVKTGFLDDLCISKTETALLFSILTVPVGLGTGVAVAPREQWEPIEPGRWRVALAPTQGGGVRAAISVGF